MRMKKINFSIVLALLLMMSCKKDFIELQPVSTVSVDILFKTDKDYQDAIVGAYSVLRLQGPNIWTFGDLPSDDTEQQFFTSVSLVGIDNFSININDNILVSTWRNYYSMISRCNTILSKLEGADPAVITNKDKYTGEAKFLRALAYFDLVRIFGDVPAVTTTLTTQEAYKTTREKADKIYDDIIIKDLVDAGTKLPLKYTGADVGRATRGAAKALLGKVYLTKKDFVKAEATLQEVTTMGYALLPNFNDLFNYQKDEHHSEYIFDIEYEEGVSLGSSFTNTFAPGYAIVLNFYGITGQGGSAGSPSEEMFTLFEAKDKRKDITVAKGFTDNSGTYIPTPTYDIRTFTKKYFTKTLRAGDSKANWKVIRYADVLLMYAEALNENGKTDLALENLNKVHVRAGLDPLSNLTKDQVREKIYLERRLELYLEGHRWFDLVRTGRALTVLQPKGMKPHMTVFPIPLSQVQLINDNAVFPQNPGYN
ncbi:MAG: RagB/SusD family nutrient uptake outer membrane protein [Segetibacter sp.]|nr:RagB/SusD family nutrient uptake outer membrane protein [Segetibacter sp.]